MATLIGKVIISKVKIDQPVGENYGVTTWITVMPDSGEEIPTACHRKGGEGIDMHISGRHQLGGQRIKVSYDPHPNSPISSYDILDSNRNVIHSDINNY